MEVDYLNYSLQELHEAWMTIDDYAYPERAIKVYQLLKNAEAKATEDNSSNASSTWVVSVLRNFSRPRLYNPSFSDILLEESSARMKEQRVIKLIAKRESIDH
jgi:hypothetical protein